jgi:hypothetical protein
METLKRIFNTISGFLTEIAELRARHLQNNHKNYY